MAVMCGEEHLCAEMKFYVRWQENMCAVLILGYFHQLYVLRISDTLKFQIRHTQKPRTTADVFRRAKNSNPLKEGFASAKPFSSKRAYGAKKISPLKSWDKKSN
ncbi:hypothetical protein CXF70_00770 [Planomicrobium sp. MB-3u-38]|nr:hypothetical protein CXF70_00770 [Planomicrobium sp. MB-3u-38]